METASSPRRIRRIRHELHRREVEVLRIERTSPHFASVIFGGAALAGFASEGFDDHVKLTVADEAGEPVRRDYTPRRFNPATNELVVEFALHGAGEAAAWAERAVPGMRATIGGPKSSMVIPDDYPWHLLAGDTAALPAIRRRLEELPAGAMAIVLAQVDPADRLLPASAATVDCHWLAPHDDIAACLADLPLPPGEGFVWCGGEAAAMARVRDVLIDGKRHPREAMRVAAYWKREESGFHQTLERGVDPDLDRAA